MSGHQTDSPIPVVAGANITYTIAIQTPAPEA